MKKIPTLFERDWNGDRSRVIDQVHPGCEWVLAGEGRATRKFDGTCCLVRGGDLYKRREIGKGQLLPPNFELVDIDKETGKQFGWLPCGPGPEDRWHMEAFEAQPDFLDGTYELVGPKSQGNPEQCPGHQLVAHGAIAEDDVPRSFEGLREWFMANDQIEGIVFHHPDGRMAKIKLRDFGIKRRKSNT